MTGYRICTSIDTIPHVIPYAPPIEIRGTMDTTMKTEAKRTDYGSTIFNTTIPESFLGFYAPNSK